MIEKGDMCMGSSGGYGKKGEVWLPGRRENIR